MASAIAAPLLSLAGPPLIPTAAVAEQKIKTEPSTLDALFGQAGAKEHGVIQVDSSDDE